MIENLSPNIAPALPPQTAASEAQARRHAGWEWSLGRVSLLFALLGVIQFLPILTGRQAFVFRDFGLFGYPLAHHAHTAFWNGEWPQVWNPLNNFGLPFLAQWNTQVFYPGSLIYLVLPLPWSLGLFCLFHQWLAGVGMFVLMRRWTGHSPAALLAGLLFAWNGLTLNCLMWPNNIAALGLLPWVIWSATRAAQEGGRWLTLATLIGAAQLLAGAPEIFLFTWVALAGWWLVDLTRSAEARLQRGARMVLLVGLISLVSAAQLLPFAELLSLSHRQTGFGDGQWAMPAWGWANLLVPAFGTFISQGGVAFQPGQFWTSSYYVGGVSILLAILGTFLVRDRRFYVASAALLVGLLLGLGLNGPIYPLLQTMWPGLTLMRFPIKFVVLAIVALPIMAGFALARLATPSSNEPADGVMPNRWRIVVATLVGLLIATLTVRGWATAMDPNDGARMLANGLVRVLFFVGALLVGNAWVRSQSTAQAGLLYFVLVCLVWADLVSHAPTQNPTVSAGVYREIPELEKLRVEQEADGGRVMLSWSAMERFAQSNGKDLATGFIASRLGAANNCNLIDGLAKADGFFSLYLQNERDLHFRLFGADNQPHAPLTDFLGITRISAPQNALEWERRPSALPRLSGGQRPIFAGAEETLRGLTEPGFNPRQVVYLPPSAQGLAVLASAVRVTNTVLRAGRIQADVDAAEAGLLVASETFYPGWRATVDGQSVPIMKANHAFMAIAVPAGRHRVEWSFNSPSLRRGAMLSALGLIGAMLCSAPYMTRRKGREAGA